MNNNNFFPLPILAKIEDQYRHIAANGEKGCYIYTPNNRFLPFQIWRKTRTNNITSVLLKNAKDKVVADITGQMLADGNIEILRFPNKGYDLIVYPATMELGQAFVEGSYYLEITDGVQTWYSEMFQVLSDISGLIKLEWYSRNDLQYNGGHISYQNGFKNFFYIKTLDNNNFGNPDYPFEEEGETIDGIFFPEKQISTKVYTVQFLSIEPVTDALRLVRLSDFINVTDNRGNKYICDTVLVTVNWQQFRKAEVELEINTDTIMKHTGKGMIWRADYNDDYNNDFQNK